MLTLRGLGVVFLAAAAYTAARTVGTYELFLMAYSFAGLVVIAVVSVNVPVRGLALEGLRGPVRREAGTDLEVTMTVRNRGLLPLFGVEASCRLAEPGGTRFRRIRWGGAALIPAFLRPGGGGGAEVVFHGVPRGVYLIGPVQMRLTDPFGMVSRSRDLGGEGVVRVLPRIAELDSCALYPGAGAGRRPLGRGLPLGGTGEVHALREYRPGEPLKRIHWKTTARTGDLMVKELAEPMRDDVLLVLDGSAAVYRDADEEVFERAVAAVGSVGNYLLEHGRAVGLLHHGERPLSSRFPATGAASVHLLDRLAEVRDDAHKPLSSLFGREEGLLRKVRGVVVFSAAFDRSLRTALTGLHRRGVDVALVHVDPSHLPGRGVGHGVEVFLGGLEREGIRTVRIPRERSLRDSLELGRARGVAEAAGAATGTAGGAG